MEVRSDSDRRWALLMFMAGILAAWLQAPLRVAWALFGAVVLVGYEVRIAMQKRQGFLLTEAGDFLLTEAGDRLLLE